MDYTIRSDVWSTGISLLELVKNRFPFPNDLAAIELMMYITQNEVHHFLFLYLPANSRSAAARAGGRGGHRVERGDEGLHQSHVSCSPWLSQWRICNSLRCRLTRDPRLRPTPKDMLAHPWIISTMAQELSMAYWMRKVWGWPKRKSEEYVS